MEDEPGSETQSFIVRIWKEGVNEWRGSIVHVGSGKRLFFRDVAKVQEFIEIQTGMGRQSLRTWLRKILGSK